ncbi:hypothetical protein [Ancylobacter radicis]|uniref:Porin n=1 Tax=Ancylobacter radicis TaxID=2836179 RepID=A0ABS5R6W6_9HYPH|nr:hypothetical protein [Ancylobacter radicis]MBS9477247.1 hypothetical protein [Ancylobacter radicis]
MAAQARWQGWGIGAAILALLAAPAGAGTANAPGVSPPGVATPGAKAAPAAPAGGPDPLCAAYGPGFTRLEGTSTCMKMSGYGQVDGAAQGAAAAGLPGALSPALRGQ